MTIQLLKVTGSWHIALRGWPNQLSLHLACYRASGRSGLDVERQDICRYEIEKSLADGSLAVKDIPSVWNSKMQEYLGVTPDSDAKGCLQDMVRIISSAK